MNWRLTAIEVTKYNPENRGADGVYLLDEWTDYSDVGKMYNGKIVTLEEYEVVEASYTLAAKTFFSFFKCETFLLDGLMFFDDGIENEGEQLIEAFRLVDSNRIFGWEKFDLILQLMQRGYMASEVSCLSNHNIVMRLSYDYYMYLNAPQIREVIELLQQVPGLYLRYDKKNVI